MAQADKFVNSVHATGGYAPSYTTRHKTTPWYKIWAITMRGLGIAKSYRLNFVGTYLGAVLYVFFYNQLAHFIGQRPSVINGYGDYFTFLLIGGVMARFLAAGMKSLSREIEHEMVAGTVEPLMMTATHSAVTLLGSSAWLLVESIIVMVLQLGVGVLFLGADLSQANWLSVIVATLLSIIAFNSWGILSAAFMLIFKRADPINWLIDLTTFVLCGVYFPVTFLPAWLQTFSYVLPLTYSLEALRGALMRGQSLYDLRAPLLGLMIFDLILTPVGLFAFSRALAYAKRTGSLGQY